MPRSLSFVILSILLAAFPAAAQSPESSSPPPASQAQDAAPLADAKKPKKVWTNENLAEANGAVSVVGDAKSVPKAKSAPTKPADAQFIASTRKQLQRLQQQIADADKQITDLTNFSKGEPSPSSGIQIHKGYNRDPIDAQIRALEEKKKQVQGQIDTLLDEARKRGIEPGQLR